MTPAAVLSILVQADGVMATQRQIQGLDKDLDKADRTAGRTRSTFSKIAGGAAALGGIAALGAGVRTAIGEFEEARKVGAQTTAVIKSTGGVANVTAKDVDALAGAISRKAGMDDEAIQKGANLLLTFKNIRNETGKGRDVFNQATQAAVDLSAAGFGSLESTSKQLGKALNDPVKGLTALGRAGVTFSEDQKKAIEALMATGKAADRVKAQQLILREVQSQVGGSAAAQATPMDHLRVTLGNLAETVGGVVVPALDMLATAIVGAGDVVGSVTRFFKEHETVALALGVALGTATAAFVALKVATLAQATAAGIALVANAGLATSIAIALGPVGLIIAGITALAAALVIAYKESETFRNIVDTAFGVVKDAAGILWDVIKVVFPAIGNVIETVWNGVRTITVTVWNAVKGFLIPLWDALEVVVTTYFNAYKAIITTVWNAIRTVTVTAWNAIKGVLGVAFDAIEAVFRPVFETYRTIVTTTWNAIRTVTAASWDAVKDFIIDPVRRATELVRNALGGDGLLGWLRDRFEDFKNAAERMAAPFVTAFEKIGKAVEKVLGFFRDIVGAVDDVVDAIGKIKVPDIDLPDLNPFGGRGGGNVGPGGAAPASVDGFNSIAARFGNVVTSAYRPGDPGYHGQNRARDYAGGNMLGFATYMAAQFGGKLLELIHTPLGFGIKNGSAVPLSYWGAAVNADHYDHVHVAMANGGYVKRAGWALVGEKGPELAHLPSGTTVYSNRDSRQMAGGSNVRVLVEDHRIRVYVDEVEQIVDQRLGRAARQGGRALPGRGGGLTRG